MKNMMIGLGIGMAGGMGVAAYMMMNPNTKRNANKMLNKAMDNANMALDDMKNKIYYAAAKIIKHFAAP